MSLRPRPLCRVGLVLLVLAACSPALDWRQVRPPDTHAEALFPCKPDSHARPVMLAGVSVRMSLFACTASGHTFALSYADLGDPTRVSDALSQLRSASAANLRGRETSDRPWQVPGMTPQPQARRVVVEGRLPDGSPAVQEMAVFARGTAVYQASLVGARPDTESADTFLGSLVLR